MREHWSHIWGADTTVKGAPNSRGWLGELLDSYRDTALAGNAIKTSVADRLSRVLRFGIELLSALFFLIILYLVLWKIVLTVMDGTGNVCAAPQGNADVA